LLCLSVRCKWPLFLGTLCFMSIGSWLAFMSGDALIWWNRGSFFLSVLLLPGRPLFFCHLLFLCLSVQLHCRPTDDDNKWGLICLVCCNIFLTHLFLACGRALLSLFAAYKSEEGLHQPGGKLLLGRYSSSSCGFSLGLWQGV